jgi:hypothetical protein
MPIVQNLHATSANPHAHVVWKPLCSGACQVQAIVPVSLLVQKSWLTQIPHRHLTGHNGLYLASSIITWMFFSLSRLNTVQNNKDTKKRKYTHTLSLSLSLSLTFSWRPARSPDKTAPCKSQPHHHKSMFLEENCSVLTCASVHVSCENLFIPVLDWYWHLDIPVWSRYWVSLKNPYEPLVLVLGPSIGSEADFCLVRGRYKPGIVIGINQVYTWY